MKVGIKHQKITIEATAIAANIWYTKNPAPVAALPSEGTRSDQEPAFECYYEI